MIFAWIAKKIAGLMLPAWLPWAAGGVAALAVAGGLLYVKALRADLAAANATIELRDHEICAAAEANRVTLEALAATNQFHARQLAAVRRDRAAALAELKRAEEVKAEARHAIDNRPLSPVMRRALDRLFGPGP